MTRDELFSRLIAILGRENIRAANNDYEFWARCPCHDDSKPSLHLTFTAERLLVYCFAGCKTERILAALGLTFADLFYGTDKRSRRPPRNWPIAAYNYVDEAGNLVFQVLKYPDPEKGKTFRQRRPGPDGWVWNLDNTRRVLYRLPEVLAAVREGRTIFVVEGEKDADNLAALGLVATTNPGGAGKWRPEYGEILRGAKVVVLPDNDEPGKKHAEDVARALAGVAAEVKVVQLPDLPPKGDVSDWLAAGGTKEELLALADQAEPWQPSGQANQATDLARPVIVRLSDVEAKEVEWLWPPYLPLGKLTILEGDPGVGKTWLALEITASVTTGRPFPDFTGVQQEPRAPANVIYMSGEDGLSDTLRPRLEAAGADLERVHILVGSELVGEDGEKHLVGVTLQDLAVLEAALKEVKPVLVVVDPLQAYLGPDVDLHRANETRPILMRLGALAERHNCAVLLIRHLGKAPQDRPIYRGLGSIDLSAAARSIVLVAPDRDDERKRVLAHVKCSLAPLGPSLAFEISEGRFVWRGLSEATAEALLMPPTSQEKKAALEEAQTELEEAMNFLRETLAEGPRPAKEILDEARKIGIAKRTLDRAKARLRVQSRKDGDLDPKTGQKTWRWHPPEAWEDAPGDIMASWETINTYVGNVGDVPETVAAQGINQDCQGCQMAILDEAPKTQESQGFEATSPTLPSIGIKGNGSSPAADGDLADDQPARPKAVREVGEV